MKNYERIELLDELLRNKRYPNYGSFVEILEQSFGEYSYSKRSFERDIKEIREKLEIRFPTMEEELLRYNALKGGYEYLDGYSLYTNLSKNERANIVELAKYLELNPQLLSPKHTALFQKIKGLSIEHQLSEKHEQMHWSPVQLIEEGKRAGQDYVEPLLGYIQNLQSIEIDYQSLSRNNVHEHKILPLLLKEHVGPWYTGWYLLAYPLPRDGARGTVEINSLIVFALDRIKNIRELQNIPLPKINKTFKPQDYFKNVYGIMRNNLGNRTIKPEKVQLESKSDWAYYYLKQYKIHPSQKILADDKEKRYLKIELTVEINVDLILLLHKQRGEIRVLKPVRLVREVDELSR